MILLIYRLIIWKYKGAIICYVTNLKMRVGVFSMIPEISTSVPYAFAIFPFLFLCVLRVYMY